MLRTCDDNNNNKNNTRFPSSNINNKRNQGMGTPSQDVGECERKQPINMLAKLQKTTLVINFKYKHLFIKTWMGVGKQKTTFNEGKRDITEICLTYKQRMHS